MTLDQQKLLSDAPAMDASQDLTYTTQLESPACQCEASERIHGARLRLSPHTLLDNMMHSKHSRWRPYASTNFTPVRRIGELDLRLH